MATSAVDIAAAFFAVANSPNAAIYINKWTPAILWANMVKEKLCSRKEVKPKALFRSLSGKLERDLSYDTDDINETITCIRWIEQKLDHRRNSITSTKDGKKKYLFFKVEMESTLLQSVEDNKDRDIDLLTQSLRTLAFQQVYNSFASYHPSREDSTVEASLGTLRVTPNTVEHRGQVDGGRDDVQEEHRAVTPTETTLQVTTNAESNRVDGDGSEVQQQHRVVTTPTELDQPQQPLEGVLHEDGNEDLLELFRGLLGDDALKRNDTFKFGLDGKSIREAVRKYGVKEQLYVNQTSIDVMVGNDKKKDDDLSSRLKGTKHETYLEKRCIPLSRRAVQGLLSIIVAIDASAPELRILSLPKSGGGSGFGKRFVAVTPSNTTRLLYQNGKQWFPSLCDALVGTQNAMSSYEVCFELLKLIWFHHRQAYDDLARIKRLSYKAMNPHRQIAMAHKCNLTYQMLREMRPFFRADMCNPLNSERAIQKLEASVDIKPTFTTFEEERTKRNAWLLPVDQVVRKCIDTKQPPDCVHAIVSADHGQKAFRVNVSVVQIKDGRCTAAITKLIGTADCRKDTREVLIKSGIATNLNEALHRLKDEPFYCSPIEGDIQPPRVIPVKLKATGDLAYYALMHGKDNMSPYHCWRCLKIRSEYQHLYRQKGRKLTLARMKERHRLLETGVLSRTKATEQRGQVNLPLLDCIEIEDWMFPVLHAVALLVNTPFDFLQSWCWYRLEEVPIELIEKRYGEADAALAVDKAWEKVLDEEEHYNIMNGELEELEPNNGFDDKEHEQEYDLQKKVVAAAKLSLKDAKELHKKAKTSQTKATKAVRDLEKKKSEYGRVHQDLWMQIQNMLNKDFNIHISSYHGGAMEGPECKTLMSEAVPAMNAVKAKFLEYVSKLDNKAASLRADADEVETMCEGFKRLFQYMDLMLHYSYQPYGGLSDAELDDATLVIKQAQDLWYKLMPTIPVKVHAWLHLEEDLRKYRGMKEHNEEPCELSHQKAMKHDARLKALRDFRKKTENILKFEATQDLPEVVAMAVDTQQKRPKRKAKSVSETDLQRRSYLKNITSLPILVGPFPKPVEMLKLMREREAGKDEQHQQCQEARGEE